MPKAFTEEEKRGILEELLKQAYVLFSEKGFKKTSIQDITDAAGIGKGSFYMFFGSKEEIFMALLGQLEDRIHQDILSRIKTSNDSKPLAALKSAIKSYIKAFDEEPLLMTILDEQLMVRLWSKLPEEYRKDSIENDLQLVYGINELFGGRLEFTKAPEELVGALRGVVMMHAHRNAIGEGVYLRVVENLIDLIIDDYFTVIDGSEDGE